MPRRCRTLAQSSPLIDIAHGRATRKSRAVYEEIDRTFYDCEIHRAPNVGIAVGYTRFCPCRNSRDYDTQNCRQTFAYTSISQPFTLSLPGSSRSRHSQSTSWLLSLDHKNGTPHSAPRLLISIHEERDFGSCSPCIHLLLRTCNNRTSIVMFL